MFDKIKIGTRMLMGFAVVIGLLIAVGVTGLWTLRESNGMVKAILSEKNGTSRYAEAAMTRALSMRVHEKDAILHIGAPQRQEQDLLLWSKAAEDLASDVATLDKFARTKADKDAVLAMKAALAAYTEGFNDVMMQLREGAFKGAGEAEAAVEVELFRDSTAAIEGAITKLGAASAQRMQDLTTGSEGLTDHITVTLVALTIAALAIGFAASYYTTRRITRPLIEGVDMTGKIANGDLSAKDLTVHSEDEIGFLAATLNGMKRSLAGMIGNIVLTSGQVASASEELSATFARISKRAEEQTDKAQHVATSAAQLSFTVAEIAGNASNIASSTKETARIASDGAAIVDKTITEVKTIAGMVAESSRMMASLGERSRQIGDIVNVINGIADQTNLLALNAAIEAARAGEHGRGFAVVADEVGRLAERTAAATKEIGEMITAIQDETGRSVSSMNESLQRVASGVALSTQAGQSLAMIVESVGGLHRMVEHIAASTEQISATSSAISEYIEVIAGISHETSAASGSVTASSNDLARLAHELKLMAERFKISGPQIAQVLSLNAARGSTNAGSAIRYNTSPL